VVTADAVLFGAHPDDVELTSGGLAALLAARGARVVIVDFTRGEMASRGTLEERSCEAAEAARVLGVAGRENLGLPDTGLARFDAGQQRAVVECLRRLRPSLVVAPGTDDPHPDHIEASHLVTRACYLAGLARYPAAGERHRPARLMHALYRSAMPPHVVVDVTAAWSRRMEAVRAHRSQLEPGRGPETYLTSPGFLDEVEARARSWGALAGVRYGEGYRMRGPVLVEDALALLPRPAGVAP
jgi:N-acetylglucosamine malate deacetylase 1